PSVSEKTQVVDLLTVSYEPAVVVNQLFDAYGKHLIPFFLDEDVIRTTLAISPEIRLLKNFKTKPILKALLTRHDLVELAEKPKGAVLFQDDVSRWMTRGALEERVAAIDIPDFMSKVEFEQLHQKPIEFLWDLLTFDIFKKQVLNRNWQQ
ncbi:MAG: hypothetical protein AAF485_31615, partial [Chloroflexota bacterium]